jgi:S1-C subfamily serine protease
MLTHVIPHRLLLPSAISAISAILAASPCAASATDLPGTIRTAQKAAVEVLVDGQLKGSGAFVDGDGTVITASHIFKAPGARFEVIDASGKRLPAKRVAIDKGHDLLLLEVPGWKGSAHAFLEIAGAIPPVASPIYNLGNALRVHATVMGGIVSQEHTTFSELTESNGYIENFLVAGMTPSLTSGGVWIDARGRIVGVQNGRLNDGKVTSGLAIIAPPKAVARLVATRIDAATPDFGAWVWEVWTTDKSVIAALPEGTEGLVVTWLRKGGPLESAGIKRLDTIVALDGKPVRRRDDLIRLVRAHRPGDNVILDVLPQHAKSPKKVVVTLEGQEEFWRRANAKVSK